MFSGSICAMITPWNEDGLDRDSLADLIEFQIENGTAGLVPCGTTGESATMSHEEHEEVIRFTIEQVNKRVPVIAGTGSNNTAEALSLTRAAKEMKADGALLISPYYNKPTQEGIYQHYAKIATEVDIPLVLYDCPGRTGSSIAVDTVVRLAEHRNIVALKDAEGSIDYSSAVVSRCEIDLLSGNDSMNFPIMALGGKGMISVLANIAPKPMALLAKACLEGRWADALKMHKKYFDICGKLFVESNPIPVKTAAEMMGLCPARLRLPLVPISDHNKTVLRHALQEAGLLD